jgi:cytoskeletal protein RodZ
LPGEVLKKRREELGLNVKEIANQLRLKTDYLVAIENNDIDKLPVAVYTLGYIRLYAKYLNVDPQPVIDHYSEHLSRPKPPAILPLTASEKKGRKLYYLIFAVLVSSIAFIAFFYVPQDNLTTLDLGVEEPTVRKYVTDDAQSTPRDMLKPPPESVRESTNKPYIKPDVKPDLKPDVKPDLKHDLEDTELKSDKKQTVSGEPEHVLIIKAHEITWVAFRIGTGEPREILFQPEQSKKLVFSGRAFLKIGNAGGVKINFDGRDVVIQGKSGEVVSLNLPES